MARIRSVKPEMFPHEELSSCSAEAHLLAVGLLTYSDDEGYFNANPGLVKAAIFPLRELSVTVIVLISELERINFVRLFFGADGKSYGHIVKFKEHQYIQKPKPSKIRTLDASGTPTVPLPDEYRLEGKGNGKEWKGTISVHVPEDQTPDSLMQAVATELRITDQFIRISLSEQIRLALEAGEDGQKTCEAMIESGRAYRDSKKFEFGGWKKFFGSDAWRVKPTTKRKSVVEEAYDDLHAPLPQVSQ